MKVDLAEDRFDVGFDSRLVRVEQLLDTIRSLDYEPAVVETPTQHAPVLESVDPASLPEDLRVMFAEARTTGKPVLVEFSGPG